MKRKALAKTVEKRIADLGDAQALAEATAGPTADIPLPPDLVDMCCELAYFVADRANQFYAKWHAAGEELTDEQRAIWKASQYELFQTALAISYHRGFKLALLRYADDLKQVPEAAAMLERHRRNAAKGGAARRAKAEPAHKLIRKRFRELRKAVPKKTARYLRVGNEFGISDRQVARIVDGID